MLEEEFDLRVELRFKNAVLWRAIRERFGSLAEQARKCHKGAVPLVRTASEVSGVNYNTISAWLNLRCSPYDKRYKDLRFTPAARKFAECFGRSPEELFPLSLYRLKLPALVAGEYRSEEVQLSLLSGTAVPPLQESAYSSREEVEDLLSCLSARERDIVVRRFGLEDGPAETLKQVGVAHAIGGERAAQLERRALRRMRTHARRQRLKIPAGRFAEKC